MTSTVPVRQCIAVKSLRKEYNDKGYNLKKWLKNKKNMLVIRRNRVNIIEGAGNKETITWPTSKWANPYPLSKYSLKESLKLYKEYIEENLLDDLKELKGKQLGCFCPYENKCHVDILISLYKKYAGGKGEKEVEKKEEKTSSKKVKEEKKSPKKDKTRYAMLLRKMAILAPIKLSMEVNVASIRANKYKVLYI